jgi:4-amino-4-deoxy-L-arabinose transferase-like glycosyltransferase
MKELPFVGKDPDRIAFVVSLVFFLFLFFFGCVFHTFETVGDPEDDSHVDHAEIFRSGQVAADPYRSVLYLLLAAAGGEMLGDTFTAARFLSTSLAWVFVLASYFVVKIAFGHKAGLFALVGSICNQHVVLNGLYVATDMTFAGLAALSLLYALKFNQIPKTSTAAIAGVTFGLAYFTRYTAVYLVPTLAACLLWTARVPLRKRLWGAVLFSVSAAIALLPHFFLMVRTFGTPFFNEQWRVLAFKVYSNFDHSYNQEIPYDGWSSLLSDSLLDIFVSWFTETWLFLCRGLMNLGGMHLAGAFFAVLFLLSCYSLVSSANRTRILVFSVVPVSLLVTSFFNLVRPRYILIAIPLCYGLIGHFLMTADGGEEKDAGRPVRKQRRDLAVFFLLVTVVSTCVALKGFVDAHPFEELKAARLLQRAYGTDIVVLGTGFHIQRHVDYTYERLPLAVKIEEVDPPQYYARILPIVRESGATYVLIARATHLNRPRPLLWGREGKSIPHYLKVVHRCREVVVYRVDRSRL